jgi:hypothetical protein
MDSTLIPDLLAVSLFLVALVISIRAFYAYAQSQSSRLFILGLSMGIIALTALADLVSSHVQSITLNTDWFLYIGQAVSFLFILLSFVRNSDEYFRVLVRAHVFASMLVLCLLFLAPVLPSVPNTWLQDVLSGSRCAICFLIFFYYVSAFLNKQARFSLLMSISFLLLSFGYLLILEQYFAPGSNQSVFDNAGDITRMIGLITLLAAIFGK